MLMCTTLLWLPGHLQSRVQTPWMTQAVLAGLVSAHLSDFLLHFLIHVVPKYLAFYVTCTFSSFLELLFSPYTHIKFPEAWGPPPLRGPCWPLRLLFVSPLCLYLLSFFCFITSLVTSFASFALRTGQRAVSFPHFSCLLLLARWYRDRW